jgi:hypothetical protein
VFWDKILTIVYDDKNIALQSEKTNLICAMKLLEGLNCTLRALRQNIVTAYQSIFQLQVVSLLIQTLVTDKARGEQLKDRKKFTEKYSFE